MPLRPTATRRPCFGAIFGVGAIVILPIFYACIGFVITLIMAVIYNALASAVGGIEVDIS